MSAADGGWHDLAHPVGPGAPRVATFPAPSVRKRMAMPEDPMSVTDLALCCHIGTHVDAPSHFIAGAPDIDALGLERFCGPGVVLPVQIDPAGTIDVADLRDAGVAVRPGDVVLLSSGWDAHVGTARYDDEHPSLTVAAAEWLVAAGAKLVGFDLPTPDLPLARRPAGFDWPVHKALLGAGVLIAEHLRGLGPLEGRRIEALIAPLNVVGADGAPVRALARAVADER